MPGQPCMHSLALPLLVSLPLSLPLSSLYLLYAASSSHISVSSTPFWGSLVKSQKLILFVWFITLCIELHLTVLHAIRPVALFTKNYRKLLFSVKVRFLVAKTTRKVFGSFWYLLPLYQWAYELWRPAAYKEWIMGTE